jgi:hypothetical protein
VEMWCFVQRDRRVEMVVFGGVEIVVVISDGKGKGIQGWRCGILIE